MNVKIFKKHFDQDGKLVNTIISASETEDDIGLILRMHLLAEVFLEAFILSNRDHENDDVLNASFYTKAKIAKGLGLNEHAFEVLRNLNNMRNSVAHEIDARGMTGENLRLMAESVRAIGGEDQLPLDSEGAQFRNADGSLRATHIFSSADTPNRVKLMIMVLSTFRRIVSGYM